MLFFGWWLVFALFLTAVLCIPIAISGNRDSLIGYAMGAFIIFASMLLAVGVTVGVRTRNR